MSATLRKISDAPLVFEALYTFEDDAALASYERDAAPRLRAQGAARFPPPGAPIYERSVERE